MCDKIVNAANSVSTNVINTIPRNTTSTVSINSDDEKVRYKLDRYIFAHFLLVIILIFIMVIICYHYTKHKSKQKYVSPLKI